MIIYFIRHGETDWNKQRKLQGRSDIPLNDYGRNLAKITAAALQSVPFDLVYSSPLLRARETADILTLGRNLPVHEDERLVEMCFGEGEGESLAAIHAQEAMPLHSFIHNPGQYFPTDGGESFEELYIRCQSFIEDVILPAEKTHHCMLVSGHGALIRGMIHCINKRPSSDFWTVTHKNCSVTIVSCENGKLTILEEGKIYYKEKEEADW